MLATPGKKIPVTWNKSLLSLPCLPHVHVTYKYHTAIINNKNNKQYTDLQKPLQQNFIHHIGPQVYITVNNL